MLTNGKLIQSMENGKICMKLTIEGRVQGVGFRFVARNQARARGVKGFVRNECNGDVYIEAEGPQDKVTDFISWCRVGPPAARVTNLKIEEGVPKNFSVFDIQH
jgi:acylphosphatase